MTKDEALRLALEVLADLGMKHYENTGEVLYKNTYTAIKAALEAKDEPAAWMNKYGACKTSLFRDVEAGAKEEYTIPLYTTPPQRKPLTVEQPKVRTGDCLLVGVCASEGHKIQPQRTWVGLTDKDWKRSKHTEDFEKGVDWAEAMLKAKNT